MAGRLYMNMPVSSWRQAKTFRKRLFRNICFCSKPTKLNLFYSATMLCRSWLQFLGESESFGVTNCLNKASTLQTLHTRRNSDRKLGLYFHTQELDQKMKRFFIHFSRVPRIEIASQGWQITFLTNRTRWDSKPCFIVGMQKF